MYWLTRVFRKLTPKEIENKNKIKLQNALKQELKDCKISIDYRIDQDYLGGIFEYTPWNCEIDSKEKRDWLKNEYSQYWNLEFIYNNNIPKIKFIPKEEEK